MTSTRPFDPAVLVGLPEADAATLIQLAGLRMRTVERDGKPCIVTQDYVLNRVNVAIAGGVILRARLG